VPRPTRFFYRVDLGLDQPIIDAKIPLHQLYLTECTNNFYLFYIDRRKRTLSASPPDFSSNTRSLSANRK
jgi:hypothetical protein